MCETQKKNGFALTEKIDIPRMLKFVALDNETLETIFCGTMDTYGAPVKSGRPINTFTQARNFCKKVLLSQGKHQAKYEYKPNGRIYGRETVAILKNDIRGYFLGKDYVNFDIINCIPSIFLHLANTNKIKVPILQHLVEDRDNFLKKYNTEKCELCKVWNTKKGTKDVKWIKNPLSQLRDDLIYLSQELKTDLWGLLKMGYTIESTIVNDIWNKIIKFEIYDKDGFYITNETIQEEGFTQASLLKKINKNLKIQYNTLKMKIKPIEGIDIELPEIQLCDDEPVLKTYEEMKIIVDNQLFLTKQPPTFWYRSNTEITKTEFHQISKSNIEIQLADVQYDVAVFTKHGTEIIQKSVFKRWLKDPTRRKFEGVKFLPYAFKNQDPLENGMFFNTFEGFSIWENLNIKEAKEEEEEEAKEEEEEEDDTPKQFKDQQDFLDNWSCPLETEYCDTFMKYMTHLVGGGDNTSTKAKLTYIINYIVHMFKCPEIRPDVYILLKGEQGSGKDTLYIILNLLIGMKHSIKSEDAEYIFGHFNQDLSSKVLICINELEARDGNKFAAKIKAQTTNDYNQINAKMKDIIREINVARYWIFSNKKYPTNVEYTGRREMVCNTGKELLGNKAFWSKLYKYIKEPDFALSLYKMLMNTDITDFNPRNRPITKEFKQMRNKNIPVIYKFINEECLRLNELIETFENKKNKKKDEKVIDNENTWSWDSKGKFWASKLVSFKYAYTLFYQNLPYFNEASHSERKKWIHFEDEGDISNLNDTGLTKKSIRYTNSKNVKVNGKIWVLKPDEVLSYYLKMTDLFAKEDDEEIIDCDDTLGKSVFENMKNLEFVD